MSRVKKKLPMFRYHCSELRQGSAHALIFADILHLEVPQTISNAVILSTIIINVTTLFVTTQIVQIFKTLFQLCFDEPLQRRLNHKFPRLYNLRNSNNVHRLTNAEDA